MSIDALPAPIQPAPRPDSFVPGLTLDLMRRLTNTAYMATMNAFQCNVAAGGHRDVASQAMLSLLEGVLATHWKEALLAARQESAAAAARIEIEASSNEFGPTFEHWAYVFLKENGRIPTAHDVWTEMHFKHRSLSALPTEKL